MSARVLVLIAALFATACSPSASKAPAPVDPAFGKAVRDYLLTNPEVLEEAQAALKAKRELALFKEAIADSSDPVMGAKNAKVTIVEFFDYRCPYCQRAMDWVLSETSRRKDVRVIFKEMPFMTPGSYEAAQAALAANKQGKYVAMHRALMTSKGDLTSDVIDAAARTAGVNVKRMRDDMGKVEIVQHLQRVSKLSAEAKVESTPTFIINGILVTGYDEKALNEAIEKAARG